MPVNTNGITSDFVRTMTSFSGSDINMVIGTVLVGIAAGVSYSLTREKAPVFVMGNPSPVSFSRGKRGIAGSMTMTIFDRSGFHDILKNSQYASKVWDITRGGESYQYNDGTWSGLQSGETLPEASTGNPVMESSGAIGGGTGLSLKSPTYADQLPPFDISLTARNEVGSVASMVIYGAEIVNEGTSSGLNDIGLESNFTWVARELIGWTPANVDENTQSGVTTNRIATELVTIPGPSDGSGR